jgi:hypothetical protein
MPSIPFSGPVVDDLRSVSKRTAAWWSDNHKTSRAAINERRRNGD